MKKRYGILTGTIVVCVACALLAAAGTQASDNLSGGTVVGITSGRARSLATGAVGLISLGLGVLALVRSGAGEGRVGAILALVLGLIGIVLSVMHITGSTGFGTGGGRAGAIVALVLALIGMILGGLALSRSRRQRAEPGPNASAVRE